MADIKHLRLVLPDVLARLRETPADTAFSAAPTLQALLRQGVLKRLWNEELGNARLDPWQASLLNSLPLEVRSQGWASAALSWRGEGGALNGGTWLQVEPVHLTAGMDDLRLGFPPQLSVDETLQLTSALQPLLSLAGFELHSAASGQWFLWCARTLNVTTCSPRSGFATRLYDIMPQGEHGGEIRRLMTEAQMLLHQHPVNVRREQLGIASVNSLWLWGAGVLGMVTAPVKARVLSNRPYVHGLCEQLRISCWPVPPDATTLLTLKDSEVLAVIESESLVQLENDWLRPIAVALHAGRIAQLELYIDHWRLTLKGGRWQQLRRALFRNAHELTDVLA